MIQKEGAPPAIAGFTSICNLITVDDLPYVEKEVNSLQSKI